MSEMRVWDGDSRGALDGIDEAVLAVGHGEMIEPDIGWSKDGYAIAITDCSKADMIVGVSNHTASGRKNVVDVKTMDDHIPGELNANTSTISNMHIGTTSINGLIASHQQFLG